MNAKETALESLRSSFRMFQTDLEALPEAAFTRSFGERVRTVADIVYEINLVNDHVGLTIRNEPLFDWPEGGFVRAPRDFTQKEQILTAFQESAQKFIQTIEGFREEDLHTPIESDGRMTDRAERCRFVTHHLWYHSGQLNFIQTLLGDDAWHWT